MSEHEANLLYSIQGIKAYHVQDGEEHDLNVSGPQTLSLLMVPTQAPAYTSGPSDSKRAVPEIDFFLHINLPPELDLPLPATTQIYHQPPRSYLIPRWDIAPEGGCFTRIEFPPLGRGVRQEDVDTFETILAQCTAFLEREPAPSKSIAPYNPGDFKPGQAYAAGTARPAHGQIVLVDEENGSVVGEMTDAEAIVHDEDIKAGQKGSLLNNLLTYMFNLLTKVLDPVEIFISPDGKRIDVRPLSEDYLALSRLPHYQNSSIVQNAAAASRLIVTTSSYIANAMTSGAQNFQNKTKPASKPVVFSTTTHASVRRINTMTAGAASVSAKTVGQAQRIAQNIGAKLTGRGERKGKADDYKPGILNKSMIAFSTVADGVATSGKHILGAGASSATAVVGHRYGEDARKVAGELTTGITNVGLVYIDVTGVSRRAVIKSVAKGMVVGSVPGGGTVIVGGGDGGDIPPGVIAGPSSGSATDPPPPGYSAGEFRPPGAAGGSEKWH